MKVDNTLAAILAGATLVNQCSASGHAKHDDVHQEVNIPEQVLRAADYIVQLSGGPSNWKVVITRGSPSTQSKGFRSWPHMLSQLKKLWGI